MKYLENWIDAAIVRYPDIAMLEKMRKYSEIPIINAMTDENHPCEILTDLYTLSKIRKDFRREKYLFCGAKGNIGLGWKEVAEKMELDLSQCCPKGYEMEGISVYHDIKEAVKGKDIICTDSVPTDARADFRNFQNTSDKKNLKIRKKIINNDLKMKIINFDNFDDLYDFCNMLFNNKINIDKT